MLVCNKKVWAVLDFLYFKTAIRKWSSFSYDAFRYTQICFVQYFITPLVCNSIKLTDYHGDGVSIQMMITHHNILCLSYNNIISLITDWACVWYEHCTVWHYEKLVTMQGNFSIPWYHQVVWCFWIIAQWCVNVLAAKKVFFYFSLC